MAAGSLRRLLGAAAPALLLAAACTHPEVKPEPPPKAEPQPPPPQPARRADLPRPAVLEGLAMEFRPQAQGQTLLEVLQPEGARVEIADAQKVIARDTAPMTVVAMPEHWYRVRAKLPSGLERTQKVQAIAGAVVSLRFVDVAAQGPTAMTRDEFRRLVDAMDREPGDASKLSVLRTAAAHAYFTTAMAGVIVEHITYRENKLQVIPIVKDRILDKQNAYTLYQHFTYREDKAKVQELLEK